MDIKNIEEDEEHSMVSEEKVRSQFLYQLKP